MDKKLLLETEIGSDAQLDSRTGPFLKRSEVLAVSLANLRAERSCEETRFGCSAIGQLVAVWGSPKAKIQRYDGRN